MKYVRRLFAALLIALMLLSGAVLAEQEIALGGIESGNIQVEAPAAEESEPDIDLEDAPGPEDIDLYLADDGLDLSAGLALDDTLVDEAAAGEQGAAAPNAEGDIPFDEAHFPDANFRNQIAGMVDPNRDGVLSAEELAGITSLYICGGGIADLRGIEYFPALQSLSCFNNPLTSLDVSGCTSLQFLSCFNNPLTSLDVSGCTSLEILYCENNQLISLDVSGCTSLKDVNCSGNQLTSLDVSGCRSLQFLSCSNNQLTSLNMSGCTALGEVGCENNRLTSLNVRECTSLQNLSCGMNQLTSLDVSGLTCLTSLSVDSYSMTNLNASGCTALKMLFCYANLDSRDVGKLTSLDVSGCTSLDFLYCHKNQLTSLNVSGCTALNNLMCGDNQLTSLDVSGCIALEFLDCAANQLTSLNMSGCTALKTLWCSNNQLTSLDLSSNNALSGLSCSNNQLTSLDLSSNNALSGLSCPNNQLTSLDVSGCTSLQFLSCSNNQLTSLNMSGCTALGEVGCENNRLTSLDLSKKPKLIKALKKGTNISEKKSIIVIHYQEKYSLRFDAAVTVTANGKTLYAPTVSLKKCKISPIADQIYTGREIKPDPIVEYGEKKLKKGLDYTLTYSANKDIGLATVTINGKGFYTDSVKKTFKINPKGVKLASLTPGAKQLTVKWKKGAGDVGYELQYSLKKDFSSKKTVTVAKTETVSQTITNLKAGKTYYVRIRCFKKVGGKKYVSDWSPALSTKVE